MKIKIYNRDTISPSKKVQVPTVSFSESGAILFNRPAGELLDLENKKYCIVQDEEKPSDWYVMEDEKSGMQARKVFEYPLHKGVIKGWQFNSTVICKDLYAAVKFVKPTTRVRLAQEPTEAGKMKLFAILTKAVL